MDLVKAKLKTLPQTVILDKWIPTTKLCPKCGRKHSISLDERTYVCECGYSEDRDIHSARNMIHIAKSCFENNIVPTEHREITLTEFKTSINDAGSTIDKSRRGSEKITPSRHDRVHIIYMKTLLFACIASIGITLMAAPGFHPHPRPVPHHVHRPGPWIPPHHHHHHCHPGPIFVRGLVGGLIGSAVVEAIRPTPTVVV